MLLVGTIVIRQAAPKPNEHVLAAINRVLDSGMYVKGPESVKLEDTFVQISGCAHNFAVNSGTSALNLIFEALEYPSGSEIIVPTNTFLASGNAVETSGYTTRFIDVDAETMNLDLKLLESTISEKTKAVLVVHLYGLPVDMTALKVICDKYNIDIIEDACQAHDATFNGQQIGSFGIASAYSLFPTKNLSVLGDGGIVSTNDKDLAYKISALRNAGRTDEANNADFFGFNYRLSEIMAAIGNAMIQSFDSDTSRRKQIAREYSSFLSDIQDIQIPIVIDGSEPVWHQYTILTDRRDELKEYLGSKGIQTSIKYPIPLHLVNSFKQKYGYKEGDFEVSEKLAKTLLCLPLHPFLTDEDVQTIIKTIAEFFAIS